MADSFKTLIHSEDPGFAAKFNRWLKNPMTKLVLEAVQEDCLPPRTPVGETTEDKCSLALGITIGAYDVYRYIRAFGVQVKDPVSDVAPDYKRSELDTLVERGTDAAD